MSRLDELLALADEYRHPDFDSDCEKLVVRLADALRSALGNREDDLSSPEYRARWEAQEEYDRQRGVKNVLQPPRS